MISLGALIANPSYRQAIPSSLSASPDNQAAKRQPLPLVREERLGPVPALAQQRIGSAFTLPRCSRPSRLHRRINLSLPSLLDVFPRITEELTDDDVCDLWLDRECRISEQLLEFPQRH